MSLFGIDDLPKSPVAVWCRDERTGRYYWGDANYAQTPCPECHPHDRAWIISILYGLKTRSLGATYEPPAIERGNQRVKALIEKYSRHYLNELEKHEDFDGIQLARRKANIMLRKAVDNFLSR